MSGLLQKVESLYLPKKQYDSFKVGDTISVHNKNQEGEKERNQP